jgi:hypothetical protein
MSASASSTKQPEGPHALACSPQGPTLREAGHVREVGDTAYSERLA